MMIPNSGKMKVSTPNDREIAMTREFNAPADMVFQAYTKPELLKRWLGVHNGWRLDLCEVDLRVGGKYRYQWISKDGMKMGMGGEFLEVDAPHRLVASEVFDDAWYEGEAKSTVRFVESGGITTLILTATYSSKEIRDAILKSPMDQGVAYGFDRIEDMLEGQKKGQTVLERNFKTTPEKLWNLWTSKEGIESWWGPDGFRVEVDQIELKPQGELHYTMIAEAPAMVEFMQKNNMPTRTPTSIEYQKVDAPNTLIYNNRVNFVPGQEPYKVQTRLDLKQEFESVRVTLTLDPMHDEMWNQRQVQGWEMELGKLERLLSQS